MINNIKKHILLIYSLEALFFLIFMPIGVSARNRISQTLSVKDETAWIGVEVGVERKEIKLERDLNPLDIKVTLIRFDMRHVKLKVVLSKNLNLKNSTLSDIVKKSNAFCGINGGFFDTSGKPLGLLISEYKKFGEVRKNSLIFSGIFYSMGNRYFIGHRSVFSPKGVEMALQAGPRLIVNGRRSSGAEIVGSFWLPDIRSGIAIDKKGRIISFVTDSGSPLSGLTLFEVQGILLSKDIMAKNALNLDGGSSSQLVLNSPKYSLEIGRRSKIPVAICFFRR